MDAEKFKRILESNSRNDIRNMKIAQLEVADSSVSCSDMNGVGGKTQRQPSNPKYKITYDAKRVNSIFDLVREAAQASIFDLVRNPLVHDSLTWSGHKLQGRRKWNGLDISIENRRI